MTDPAPRPKRTIPELIVLCVVCMLAAYVIDHALVWLGVWPAEKAWFERL